MTEREALKLALEALQNSLKSPVWRVQCDQAITACKQALAQPEQSQVEETLRYEIDALEAKLAECRAQQPEPVIDKSAAIRIATALGWEPKRTWVGLTDEEIVKVLGNVREIITGNVFLHFARAIEATIRSKNP